MSQEGFHHIDTTPEAGENNTPTYEQANTEKFIRKKERILSFKEQIRKKINERFFRPEQKNALPIFSVDSAQAFINNPEENLARLPQQKQESVPDRKNQYDQMSSIFGKSLLNNLTEIFQTPQEESSTRGKLQLALIEEKFSEKTPGEQRQIFARYLLSLSHKERKEVFLELNNPLNAENNENTGINTTQLEEGLNTLNTTLLHAKLDNITLTAEDYKAISQNILEAQRQKQKRFERNEVDSHALTEAEIEQIFTDYVYNNSLTKEEQIFITTDSYAESAIAYTQNTAEESEDDKQDEDEDETEGDSTEKIVSKEEQKEIADIAAELNPALQNGEGKKIAFIETESKKGYICPLSPQSAIYITKDGNKEIILETGEHMPISGEITKESIQKTNDILVSSSIIRSLQLNKFFPNTPSKLRFVSMCMKKNETSLHQGTLPQYDSSNAMLSPQETETRVRTLLRVITGIPYSQNTKANDSQKTPENTIQQRLLEMGILGSNGRINKQGGYLLFRHLKNFYDQNPVQKHTDFITSIKQETKSADKSTIITKETKNNKTNKDEVIYSISSVSDSSVEKKFQIRDGNIITTQHA